VRSAEAEDVATLVELIAGFSAESGFVLDPPCAEEALAALLTDLRLGRVRIVEQGSDAVSHLVATFVFSMKHGASAAVVDDFTVRPGSRGAGLGSAALAEVR